MLDTKALAEATAVIVREAVASATAPLVERIAVLEGRKAPQDGKDADPEVIRGMVADAVAAIDLPQPSHGKDGADADMDLVKRWIEEAVAALPKPLDGKSLTNADVSPLIEEAVAKAVAALPVAKDGVGLAGAMIDRAGSLVITLTDGTMRDLGRVEGKDGESIEGKPGLGFDDLTFAHDGERGFVLRFVQGDRVKEFPFAIPVVLDRGVFREGEEYQKGDAVTFGGSLWIAQQPTKAKPDGPDSGWRLSVKRGRDGKQA